MPAELGAICERLNGLLGRLERSFERDRRFSADVAHELRTPIAELRSLAEVALKWPEDPGASTRALSEALDIALQMESLAGSLLELVRCETGTSVMRRERIVLAELIREAWRPFAQESHAFGFSVDFDLDGSIILDADRTLLAGILTNLFSNAVAYSSNRGVITATLRAARDEFALTISNPTNGLTRADLPHLFERFWRKESARSQGLHSGVALSLAKAFENALNLKIRAEFAASGRLAMVLSRPREINTSATTPGSPSAASPHRQTAQTMV